jgi:serine/threonine-protein kinase
VTRKVDIYAATVVLWELLVGHPLFLAENEGATLTKVLLEDVVPPSVAAKKSGVPLDAETMGGLERLDEVTARGLDRDAAKRFETAREMALVLEGCVPPATASEVSAWIEQVASSTLLRRAEEVTAIESGSFTNPRATLDSIGRGSQAVEAAEPLPVAAPKRTRVWTVFAGVAGVGIVLASLLLVLRARTPVAAMPVAASIPSAPLPIAPAPSVADSVAPSALPADSPSMPAGSSPPTLASASTETPPRSAAAMKRIKPALAPRPAPGCDPPYTWDGEGRKHYKAECL